MGSFFVIQIYAFFHYHPQFLLVGGFPVKPELFLHCPVHPLGQRVFVRVGVLRHAQRYVIFFCRLHIFTAAVLEPPVRMVYCLPAFVRPVFLCHPQRPYHTLRLHVVLHRVAHYFPAVGVGHHVQVTVARTRPYIRYVTHPHLVGAFHRKTFHDVRPFAQPVFAHGGLHVPSLGPYKHAVFAHEAEEAVTAHFQPLRFQPALYQVVDLPGS